MKAGETIKNIIHPPAIRKKNLLYRGWRFMRSNPLWQKPVPDEAHICAWFHAAWFATFFFVPIFFPLLWTFHKIAWILLSIVYWSCWGISWPFRKILVPMIENNCRKRIGRFLTVGSVILLTAGIVPLFIPAIRHWYVGSVTVFCLALFSAWIILSAVGAFFKTTWNLMKGLADIWSKGRIHATENYFLALILVGAIAVYISPIYVFDGFFRKMVTLVIPITVLAILSAIFIGALLFFLNEFREGYKERKMIERLAAEQDLEREAISSAMSAKEKRTSVFRLWWDGFINMVCPKVRFVD